MPAGDCYVRRGCCWDSSVWGVPWCFYGKDVISVQSNIDIHCLRQGGYVMSGVCLFVCLFVWLLATLRKTTERIFTKIYTKSTGFIIGKKDPEKIVVLTVTIDDRHVTQAWQMADSAGTEVYRTEVYSCCSYNRTVDSKWRSKFNFAEYFKCQWTLRRNSLQLVTC